MLKETDVKKTNRLSKEEKLRIKLPKISLVTNTNNEHICFCCATEIRQSQKWKLFTEGIYKEDSYFNFFLEQNIYICMRCGGNHKNLALEKYIRELKYLLEIEK